MGFVYGVGAVGQRLPPNYTTTKVTPASEMVRVPHTKNTAILTHNIYPARPPGEYMQNTWRRERLPLYSSLPTLRERRYQPVVRSEATGRAVRECCGRRQRPRPAGTATRGGSAFIFFPGAPIINYALSNACISCMWRNTFLTQPCKTAAL